MRVREAGILELEDHHDATRITKPGSGRMLRLGRHSDEDQHVCIILKCLPTDCLLVAKIGRKNSTYIVENLDNTLTKSSKLTFPVRTALIP